MTGGVAGLQGSLAEYAAVDARLLAHKPTNLSWREAAALRLAFITAWEGLVDRADVHTGQSVQVQGGAGGVGHIVVARGAIVLAVASAARKAFLRQLGATPIDYRELTVEQYAAKHADGRGFAIVCDTVGGASLDASFKAVRGHVVSCLGWGSHSLAALSFRAASSGVFTLLPMLTREGRAHHGVHQPYRDDREEYTTNHNFAWWAANSFKAFEATREWKRQEVGCGPVCGVLTPLWCTIDANWIAGHLVYRSELLHSNRAA
jgi:NADPH:quinone reductase